MRVEVTIQNTWAASEAASTRRMLPYNQIFIHKLPATSAQSFRGRP